jgi:aminocarboxymuconate-semialdehyde decarboxylase
MIVDVHNHFYPPEYIDALRGGDSAVKVTVDSEGNPCLHYPGDYNVAVQGHRDIDYRQGAIARCASRPW